MYITKAGKEYKMDRNKFDGGDSGEYLDCLGRYRQTEQALETASDDNLIHFVDEPFIVTNRFGLTFGPFISWADAYAWSKKTFGNTDGFIITGLKKP